VTRVARADKLLSIASEISDFEVDAESPSALTKPDPFSLTETDPGDAQESVICAMSAVSEGGLTAPRSGGGAL
jgi:hypothetical protein